MTSETLAVTAASTKDKKKRQELKNTGQSYVNTKGKLVDAKRVWPQDCSRFVDTSLSYYLPISYFLFVHTRRELYTYIFTCFPCTFKMYSFEFSVLLIFTSSLFCLCQMSTNLSLKKCSLTFLYTSLALTFSCVFLLWILF